MDWNLFTGERAGTDALLLADFAKDAHGTYGADLGCGSGILLLLLLLGDESRRMTGVDIRESAAASARENLRAFALEERGEAVCADYRSAPFESESLDFIVSNPPYFPAGHGAVSPDAARAAARGETQCSMEEICAASAFLCRTGGSVNFVHKPERLSELFCCMTAHGIEPKRLRLVCHREGAAPNLVLIEGRRGGKPGLKIEPTLILRRPDGSETDEVRRIYHR